MGEDKNLLYFCDPSKNTECKKGGCYLNGGPCRYTTHAEYADTTDYAFPAMRGTEWAQIVRCKDCKYVGTDATMHFVCNREGMGLRPFQVYHDDYCSYGELKYE